MPANIERYRGKPDKSLDQDRFLQAFASTCSTREASRLTGVSWQTHCDWLREDSKYRARFRQARSWTAQALEDEAVRRAIQGVRRPVLYKGKQVYFHGEPLYRVEYSDRLLIRLLEAFLPEKYRTDHTNLLEVDPKKLTLEQLDVLAEHLVRFLGYDPDTVADGEPTPAVNL